MPYGIALFLDEASDKVVRDYWDHLAQQQISDQIASTDLLPHLTVTVCDDLDLPTAKDMLQNLADATPALQATWATLGLFPGGTLFLAPVVTEALLQFRASAQEVVSTCGGGLWSQYDSQNWVPHCTLALDLHPQLAAKAVETCLPLRLPIFGKLESVGILCFEADWNHTGDTPDPNPLFLCHLSKSDQ